MDTKTTKRPQHFLTLLPAKGPNDWPEDWKKDPNKLKLVGQHQQWLAHPCTEQLHKILQAEVEKLALTCASTAVNNNYTAEQVRMYGARLSQLIETIKITYDTEQYVSKAST